MTNNEDRRIQVTESGEQILPQIGSLLAAANIKEQQTPLTFDPETVPQPIQDQQSQDIGTQETVRLEKQTITLLTGEVVNIVLKPRLSGKQFFIYQGKVRQLGQMTADNWLVLERVYSINGVAPTLDLLLSDVDGLDGDQRSAVDKAIHSHLTPLESDEQTIDDGRVVKRRKLKSSEYLTFKAALGNNPTHAFRDVVLKSFTIDDQPITLASLEDPYQVDFDLASVMVLRLAQIFGMGI